MKTPQENTDTPAGAARPSKRRLAPWLRRRLPSRGHAPEVAALLKDLGLQTVCQQAHCPNQGECFASRTATFLILGKDCTRGCRFCAIHRTPAPAPPDPAEPENVAAAAERLGLRHVVITSVTRDDLPDGGAGHFAATIRAVRARLGEATIEVLTPDFQGSREALAAVFAAAPDVFNHNTETVPRLYASVRPEADYARSLAVLGTVRELADTERAATGRRTFTKSGLMLGLGERDEEVRAVLGDLRRVGCDVLTLGQYLAPSAEHEPVAEFICPERFDAWAAEARAMGFRAVAAGPFVRSSYHAEEVLHESTDGE